jgi:outer membrane protein assembly factor BamB
MSHRRALLPPAGAWRPQPVAVPSRPAAVPWLVLLLAFLLAACSSNEKPPPTPLEAFTPAIAGRQVWQAKLAGAAFPLAIVGRTGQFVVAGGDGSVLMLEAETGREIWNGTVGEPIAAGVGSDGRFASVVTRNNELVTLEQGRPLWRMRLPSRVLTAPLVAGERVFVLGVDRSVQAFDALDGRRLWTLQRPGDALTLAQPGVITAWRNLLLVGQGPRLAALDPLRGNLRWEVTVANPRGTNEVERLADLVGPPLRLGDRFCVRAFQSAVGCVDAARGALVWSRPGGGTRPVGGDEQLLFGADASDRITAWRTETGETAWTNERLLYRGLSVPLAVGPTVVFGDVEGQVHFLSREDGRTLLRLPTDGTPVVGAPVLSGTTMLVATRGGGLFAFRPQ